MNQMEIKRKQILLLTYVPGVLCLLWMLGRIGDNGAGYFGGAVICYLALLMPFFFFLPEVIEKLLRARMSKGQYKNAGRMWKCAFVYSIVAGVSGAVVLGFGAGILLEKILRIPYGVFALRLLAPALFVAGVSSALKGYFQGLGTGMPTVVSEIVTVLTAMIFGVIFELHFREYGEKVAALLQNPDFTQMYGAAGIVLGYTVGSLFGLIFLILLFIISDSRKKQRRKTGMKMTEDWSESLRLLFLTLIPYLALGILIQLPAMLGTFFYQHKNAETVAADDFGIFACKYLLWFMVLIFPLLAGCVAQAGRFINYMKKEEFKQGKDSLQASLVWTIMTSSFVSAAMICLGPNASCIFGGNMSERTGILFQAGGILALLTVPAVLFGMILWESGRIKSVLLTLAGSCLCFALTVILALQLTGGSILSLLYGTIVQMVVCLTGTGFLIFRQYHLTVEWIRGILFPMLGGAVAGLIMLLLGRVLFPALGNLAGVIICIVVGLCVQMILFLVLRCAGERELAMMPGGSLLIRIGNFMHLL